jgi:hypothetical protein
MPIDLAFGSDSWQPLALACVSSFGFLKRNNKTANGNPRDINEKWRSLTSNMRVETWDITSTLNENRTSAKLTMGPL